MSGRYLEDLIDEFRRGVVEAALIAEDYKPSRAARRLGITREYLYKLRRRYGLPIADPKQEPSIPKDFRARLESAK